VILSQFPTTSRPHKLPPLETISNNSQALNIQSGYFQRVSSTHRDSLLWGIFVTSLHLFQASVLHFIESVHHD
jgi:hypothetical protein